MSNYQDAFGQQVVNEWNANWQSLAQNFGTFENYLSFRRQQESQQVNQVNQPYQQPKPSPIGYRPAGYINKLLPDNPSAPTHQKPAWLENRYQAGQQPPPQFPAQFGFGASMPLTDNVEEYEDETPAVKATPADTFMPTVKMPRIFQKAETIRPSEVEASILDVAFRFFLSLVMVFVDLVTNVAFLVAPRLNPFEALGQSNLAHWVFGLGLVFSEYLAVSYTRRLVKGGWKNLDVMEVLLVIALWALVALNFIATYLPLYNLRVGGEEMFAVLFALALSMVVAFFSERFLTHLAEVIKALRSA